MAYFTVESVLKYYDNKVILNDIFIRIQKGETLCIVGRNGAGKTTLLNIISGIDKNCQKIITYKNQFIEKKTKKNISFSSQDVFIPDNFNIKSIFQYFQTINTEQLRNEPVFSNNLKFGDLSTGEKKYIQSLIAINSNRDICLLDEPFGYISPIYTERLIHYIKLNQSQKIFILTTHQFENLSGFCTQIKLLKGGKLHHIENINNFNIHDF